MTLERQVCNVELANLLAALDVPQDSLFFWCAYPNNGGTLRWVVEPSPANPAALTSCSAFTVAELGLLLPDGTMSYQHDGAWTCQTPLEGSETAATEADARGAMLAGLLKANLTPLHDH